MVLTECGADGGDARGRVRCGDGESEHLKHLPEHVLARDIGLDLRGRYEDVLVEQALGGCRHAEDGTGEVAAIGQDVPEIHGGRAHLLSVVTERSPRSGEGGLKLAFPRQEGGVAELLGKCCELEHRQPLGPVLIDFLARLTKRIAVRV